VSVYAAEGVLRALAPDDWAIVEQRRIEAAERAGVSFDARSALEVIQELRSGGASAYPAVKPIHFLGRPVEVAGREVLPLSGIADVVTVWNANETGERLVYESDEYGFHNPKGLHVPGALDVAVIGDSFVHGAAVPSADGLVPAMRKRIPRTLNLGMGASGPLIELAILVEYAQPLRPRAVVWVYYEGNDLSDLTNESGVAPLREYLDPRRAPWLRSRQHEIDAELVRFAEQRIERQSSRERLPAAETPSAVPGFLSLAELRSRVARTLSPGSRSKEGLDPVTLLGEVLAQARARVEGWGGNLYFVYLPQYERFASRWNLSDEARRRDDVLALVDELGIPTIDVLGAMQEHREPTSLFPFGLPGHFNAAGYELVAEVIVRRLG
jgi:lysophospholipase L1-like esterase